MCRISGCSDGSSHPTSKDTGIRNFAVAPTDLNAASTSSWNADVIFFDGNYSTYCGYTWWTPGAGGTGAITKCHSLSGGSVCGQHRIYIGNTYSDNLSTTKHRILACHETGHAIGPTHNYHPSSSNSCLRSSVLSGGGTTYYSNHEVNDSINFQW